MTPNSIEQMMIALSRSHCVARVELQIDSPTHWYAHVSLRAGKLTVVCPGYGFRTHGRSAEQALIKAIEKLSDLRKREKALLTS